MKKLVSIQGVGHLECTVDPCEVVKVQTFSETHVSGHGGGGSSDGYGNVRFDPVRIMSDVRNITQAVVRWEDGKESGLSVEADYALREGHQLTTVCIPKEAGTRIAFIYNRNTRQFWADPALRPQRKAGIVAIPIVLGVFFIFIYFASQLQVNPPPMNVPVFLFMTLLGPAIGIFVATRNVKKQNAANARRAAMNQVFRDLLPTL